ncbi:MAG: Ig-like domain-containing protein [Candidatus Kerfeldbacteria bacterium]|nr:Ig-like domain-containing protein [Candidatus Kerfeldbacteria bacterium]
MKQWRRRLQWLGVIMLGWLNSGRLAKAVDINTDYTILLGQTSPIDLIIAAVNWSLGILALIAVIIVLWGGFMWLSSQGNEERIEQAKAILRNGAIGLVIILAAWGLALYVLNLLLDFTNANIDLNEPPGCVGDCDNDGSPFYVDHSNPADNETDVTLCHIVAVTFSYPLNLTTITPESFKVTIPANNDAVHTTTLGKIDGASCTEGAECLSGLCSSSSCVGSQLDGSFDFSETGTAAVFYPSSDFYQNTLYDVELTTTIQGIEPKTGAVYNLSQNDPKREFTFATGTETDDIPPTVDVVEISPAPTDGETEVCLNPTLQASFSESLDPASPDDQNFWLYQSSNSGPSDALDVDLIHITSIGGEADDTLVTVPEDQLTEFTEYGINLYSGDAATDTFVGAIYDTCGNPLSGDFDTTAEGSPIDDFVETTSAGLNQAFCSCISGVDICQVAVNENSCILPNATTCNLGVSCTPSHEQYVGFDYQWTWTTGDEPYCTPEIDTVTPASNYYSEDLLNVDNATGTTGPEDSDLTLITGSYLYPFYDVDFNNNISAAGQNCFDTNHAANLSCFVSHVGSGTLQLRTPVASLTGHVTVDNGTGTDFSADVLTITSPYISTTSPSAGPAGQYVTIKGRNFGDYDPIDPNSRRGQVFFDTTEAQVVCADGWDDDQIIVQVPEGFAIEAVPNIQVLTATTNKYSNERSFIINDNEPGPGICELHPSCSDTGLDDVTIVGENFGEAQGDVNFQAGDTTNYSCADSDACSIQTWNSYDATYASATVITNNTPITEIDTYDLTVGNDNGWSNGLNFNITCSDPPQVLEYNQCSPEEAVYLPNPRSYGDNACVNSVVYFGFNNNMADSTVTDGTIVYQCNTGGNFDDTTCITPVAGNYAAEFLTDAYTNGTGTITLNGSTDIDGDGVTHEAADAYEAYTFSPLNPLQADTYYKVVIPNTVTNSDGINIVDTYSWYFQVRNDVTPCVADYVSLSPFTQRAVSYESANRCLDTYSYDTNNDTVAEPYSMRVQQLTADCLVLDDAGTYNWNITNPAAGYDVVQFGNDASPSESTSDTTTNGYTSVCLQGEDTINTGDAAVIVTLLNPADGSDGPSDDGHVVVDYGYCTSDEDCFTNTCQDTYCDPVTSHCAPDIISFSPNNATGTPDVGPGGCLTINGCYFGPDRQNTATCNCTAADTGEVCNVYEGSNSCILSNYVDSCTLGESLCTLETACTATSPSANFAEAGGLENCTCTNGGGSCLVSEANTSCVVTGTDTCDATDASYNAPATGSVTLNDTPVSYPNEATCLDTWDNDQVVVQVPTTITPDDYGITLASYYFNDVDGAYLSDTYSTADGGSNCTIGSEVTPCLCRVDPATAEEGTPVDLYGEHFSLLTADTHYRARFAAGAGSWVDADATLAAWFDSHIDDTPVPNGAVSDDEGVQVTSDNYTSNAIDFTVSCSSNWDCASGCCSAGECREAEICNACVNDTDCSYGACQSACVNGMCSPYITSLSPTTGSEGQPVTIQGCHFGTYYNPAIYSPTYSTVQFDTVDAPLACSTTDGWSNTQIIVTAPESTTNPIFSGTDTSANVVVQQVYNAGGGTLVSQSSNTAIFTQDNTCSAVDLPVLCNINPAYGPYGNDETLSGDNFYGEASGYCTCATASLGQCNISEGGSACTVTQTVSYYVNPSDPTETCSDTTSNAFTAYESIAVDADGNHYCTYTDPTDPTITCNSIVGATSCQISTSETCNLGDTYYVNPSNPAEVCSTATSNDYTTYDATNGYCIYTDPADASATCTIPVNQSSCAVTYSCTADSASFVELAGSVEFTNAVPADITDWTTQYTADTNYYIDVPTLAETGDVAVIATTSDATQCVSNGIEFPVSCNSCGDCASAGDNLHCNLEYDDNFGACTTANNGFCRAEPDSCCNTTSCVYDSTTNVGDDNYDYGTCASQPLILFDDVTTPEQGDTGVCPNGEFQIHFSEPIITSAAWPFNTNTVETVPADVDPNSDDIALEDLAFIEYVQLRPVGGSGSVIADINLSSDLSTLTVTQSELLQFNTQYELLIAADSVIGGYTYTVSDTADQFTGYGDVDYSNAAYQHGIVSLANGIAAGCDSEQVAAGMCDATTQVRLTFTTATTDQFATNCSPSYVTLEAVDSAFSDNDYTMTAAEETQALIATVYAAGNDSLPDAGATSTGADRNSDGTVELIDSFADSEVDTNGDGADDGADDQAITRLDGTYDWEYDWDTVYDSLTDLQADACPVVGIISEGDTGSCSCDFEESCSLAADDAATVDNEAVISCTTTSGVTCSTDSPNGICDTLDSTYDSTTNTCICTVADSCTMVGDESTCEVTFNTDETVNCAVLDAADNTLTCDETNPNWSSGGFNEDVNQQTITAGDLEDSDTISVTIIGQNATWDDQLSVAQTIRVLFCNSEYLSSYENTTYNLYWSYCRGSDPQANDFLPDFVDVFERDQAGVQAAYGGNVEFIHEVAFKDAVALTNDPNANNNTIAIRVYPNDLDNASSTVADSIDPGLWYVLHASEADASSTSITMDGYQAVQVGNTMYVAATNLNDATATVTPYIYVIAYSEDANDQTEALVRELLERFEFNSNAALAADCKLEKQKIIRDTQRINDLGTMAYLLSSYYYNDSDGDEVNNFPDVAVGSYIAGLTGSIWSSWNSVLGNALAQSLPTDPTNTYNDATNACPYHPPDLAAGDNPSDPSFTYYDEAGTCWDPVLKDYYGPAGSYLYQYKYNPSDGSFGLYGNLEYSGTGSWQELSVDDAPYNPCADYYPDFSDRGCATFNYVVTPTETTLDSDYAGNFE